MADSELIRKIGELPPGKRVEALRLALAAGSQRKVRVIRNPAQRRKYAYDPHAYIHDVLGWTLIPQKLSDAIEVITRETRVLIASANNVGKTWLLAALGCWTFDAKASLPDLENGLEEQGAKILLPGPNHDTVFATIYAEMLTHAARAEARGFLMPGERSDRSVLWHVRPRWDMEAFSPRMDASQDIAHTVSGRHHRNQWALIEEGQGVNEPTWVATEGMCSAEGNSIISSFNPSNNYGPTYDRSRSGAYRVIHLDAFSHPNIQTRSMVIPSAIGYTVIDKRVRSDCRERGPYPEVQPEAEFRDFLYALPLSDVVEERGARADGIPGHPDGIVCVYRPSPGSTFEAQVLGQYPRAGDTGLFEPGSWDESCNRWYRVEDPREDPERVGLDAARFGRDEILATPSWGEGGDALLRAWFEICMDPEQAAIFLATRRIRVGMPRVIAPGDGKDVADRVVEKWGESTVVGDIGGVGTSPMDWLRVHHKRNVVEVNFSSKAPTPPDKSIPHCENMRTYMYVIASRLVSIGLVDSPPDPQLRQEIMAHEIRYKDRTVRVGKKTVVVPMACLTSKDEVKTKIRRSPDRADSYVLTLTESVLQRPRVTWVKRPTGVKSQPEPLPSLSRGRVSWRRRM